MITNIEEDIEAGREIIELKLDFPEQAAEVQVAYIASVSYDRGATWNRVTLGTLAGNHRPVVRPSDPDNPFSFSFSNPGGRACRVKTVLTFSRDYVCDVVSRKGNR